MRTSGPGSSKNRRIARSGFGFTLIELLVVIAIIAITVGVVSLSLRDSRAAKLDEEGERLAALLEMARAEARVAGATVRWVPGAAEADDGTDFRFVGLLASQPLPTHWLDPQTRAEVVGATSVLLGPDAILPPQRIVLWLANRRLELASDGLAPFAVASSEAAAP
jgi:general secretion pathway protein H